MITTSHLFQYTYADTERVFPTEARLSIKRSVFALIDKYHTATDTNEITDKFLQK